MTENWKSVPGFEGRYEVSDLGRVKSLARPIPQKNGRTRSCGEVILKPERNNGGHLKVKLSSGHQKMHRKYVHRLVLEAFVGPCPDGMEACHWNDDPADNRLENLRWASQSDNSHDRVRNRVQYAARVIKGGVEHIITDSIEGHWLCSGLHKVLQDWHENYMDAWEYADSWNRHEGKRDGTRAVVIARYVSSLPWEVAE